MKKGNLDRWIDINRCSNLLFFSQLVNELLFDYSIPSNRVSTLNSHYLCMDAHNCIDSIDNHGVPEGTLKPIMEELYCALKKDPIYANSCDSPLDYFVKYQGEKYVLTSKLSDMNYGDLRKTAYALDACFFNDNSYYELLRTTIIDIVESNDTARQKDLFRLVKSLLTELMNGGYTLRYIYEVMNLYYWNPRTDIEQPTAINLFFHAFDFNPHEYDVVFKVNRKRMEKFVGCIQEFHFSDELNPRINTHEERQFLNKKNRECFLVIKRKSLDPFRAAESVKDMLSTNSALYRLYDHNYRYDIRVVPCIVYGEDFFYKVAQPKRAVEHTRALSSQQISDSMNIAHHALQLAADNYAVSDAIAIINAAQFHSHSLDSESEENQLLDLWSIFETILDISNKHTSDRINQVCMYLVPILKRNYIYSLFEQLATDIRNYDEQFFYDLVGPDQSAPNVIKVVCEFVLLDINEQKRLDFLSRCDDFPLLKERIEYYQSSLSKTSDVFRFVEKHGERVRWQIMRIYRNRNLIIHNGKSMPYMQLLIENLHSYVDDFLLYSIRSLAEGHNIESMCQALFVKECRWNTCFQKNSRSLNTVLISQMLEM